MTVIINSPYAGSPTGSTLDLDNATEAALVAQGRAVYSGTSPGPVFAPMTPKEIQDQRDILPATQALVSGGGIGSPMLVSKSNQVFTRNSANAAPADTTFQTLYTFTLPGGSMGPNGTLIVEVEAQATGASAPSYQIFAGATAISQELTMTANTYDNRTFYWFNTANAVNKYRATSVRQGANAGGFTATAIDTTADLTITIQYKWGSAVLTHSVIQHAMRAVVEYGA